MSEEAPTADPPQEAPAEAAEVPAEAAEAPAEAAEAPAEAAEVPAGAAEAPAGAAEAAATGGDGDAPASVSGEGGGDAAAAEEGGAAEGGAAAEGGEAASAEGVEGAVGGTADGEGGEGEDEAKAGDGEAKAGDGEAAEVEAEAAEAEAEAAEAVLEAEKLGVVYVMRQCETAAEAALKGLAGSGGAEAVFEMVDARLTRAGVAAAGEARDNMLEAGALFDVAYVSPLSASLETAQEALAGLVGRYVLHPALSDTGAADEVGASSRGRPFRAFKRDFEDLCCAASTENRLVEEPVDEGVRPTWVPAMAETGEGGFGVPPGAPPLAQRAGELLMELRTLPPHTRALVLAQESMVAALVEVAAVAVGDDDAVDGGEGEGEGVQPAPLRPGELRQIAI